MTHVVSRGVRSAGPRRAVVLASISLAAATVAGGLGSARAIALDAVNPVVASHTPTEAPAATRTSTNAQPMAWGVYAPRFPSDISAVANVEAEVGAHVNFVMWYEHWGLDGGIFDTADVQAVINHGASPVITWMSDDGTTNATYPLSRIAAGAFDGYIKSWARAIRSIHGTVFLRFDHEMNGNWYAWSTGVAGQTAADYVAAWRHIHNVFAALGVRNVKWIWSPNVEYTGSTSLGQLYPGDAYVDDVGVDGYNWGPIGQWHVWSSFAQVFGPTLADVASLTSRPVMLSEVASGTVGGDKAAWIADFFAQLVADQRIKAFIWFDANKEEDWRIDSSAATLAAFQAGLATTAPR
jgi:Glycosyl hydrolase family 26